MKTREQLDKLPELIIIFFLQIQLCQHFAAVMTWLWEKIADVLVILKIDGFMAISCTIFKIMCTTYNNETEAKVL